MKKAKCDIYAQMLDGKFVGSAWRLYMLQTMITKTGCARARHFYMQKEDVLKQFDERIKNNMIYKDQDFSYFIYNT